MINTNKIKVLLFSFLLLISFTTFSNATEIILNPTYSTSTNQYTSVTAESVFTRNLTVGSYGKDVMALKKILGYEFVYSTVDTSPTFTSNTASLVKQFQEKYATEILIPNGLSAGTGYVGLSTIKKLDTLANNYYIKLDIFTLPTISTVKNIFATTLVLGSTGDDVSLLKVVLNSDKDTKIISNSTIETDIFDSAIELAVIKFQEKYINEILIPSGLTKGTGIVGPSTRKKLDAIINSILNPSKATSTSATSTNSTSTQSTNSQIQNIINKVVPAVVVYPIPGKPDSVAPTITVTASPEKVTKGQPATLSWRADNAIDKCKISFKDSSGSTLSGTIDTTGNKSTGSISTTTTFTIVCYNKYGIPGSKNILVQVIDPNATKNLSLSKIASIVSISPLFVNRGGIVKIIGTDFLTSNNVYFDGTIVDKSLIINQSSTSISFKIPEYKYCASGNCPISSKDTVIETGGKKIVQVANLNGFSNDYYYVLPSKTLVIKGTPITIYTPPTFALTSVKPVSGNRGDTITLTGSSFSSDSIVLFGGFKVADNLIVSKNSTAISFKVPSFQMGCTEPLYEVCPKLPLVGSGTIIETGGIKNISVMNTLRKATTTSVIFTLPSKKFTY